MPDCTEEISTTTTRCKACSNNKGDTKALSTPGRCSATRHRIPLPTVREKLKSEIGLTDVDFHEVPVLYSEWIHVALNPGIQNLIVADTVLFAPDPEGPDVDGVDVWRKATRDALDGLGLDIEFVDVFYSYHFLWGEAHCGTNVERAGVTETPWWTLDGEE